MAGCVKSSALTLLVGAVALAGCGQQNAPAGAAGPNGGAAPGQIAPSSLRTDEQMQKDREALVAAMGAAAPPEAAAQYAFEFEAASQEPAWDLTVTNEYVSFRRANLDAVEGRPRLREVRAQGLLVETDELVVTVRAGECRFETGPALPFTATVFWNGASFQGCARPAAKVAGGVSSGWAVILPQVLPAVDACLRRADAKPARVTIAYPVEGGIDIGVRLIEADNGRAECVVAADGSAIRSYEGLSDRDVFPGERDPLFTRAPTAAPSGRCDQSTPALSADGATVGWLTRQKC